MSTSWTALHATFLDLDDIYEYKLYDKRDNYPFFIVACQILVVTFLHMFFLWVNSFAVSQ